jgi:SAM-dependent methyltransferase
MAKTGPDFYDDPQVFATYRREGKTPRVDGPIETLEKPVFDELTGPLTDLHILDLGCGSGYYGAEALNQSCRSYLGLEGSQNMFEWSRKTLAGTDGKVIHTRMETWTYPTQQFDLVTSRLALHYIEDIMSLFANVYKALVPGGRFIFSVEHPVITSCDRAWLAGNSRQHWIVDDYFETGKREVKWMAGELIKFHHTLDDYFSALTTNGFQVEALRESNPQRDLFTDEATYKRRKRIPLFLFIAAQRPEKNLER